MSRPQDLHDPGGKVKTRLDASIRGDAIFSPCGRYRHLLIRDWADLLQPERTILWIGMNPSSADADNQDPTCTRETNFSRDWGYSRYLKGNMLDWRATSPKDLPHSPDLACSRDNLPILLEAAETSEMVLLAYGKLHSRYHGIVESTIDALRATGKPLMCLGKNADGSAKHPLYLRKDLSPAPF